ncbi:hypothetical protein HDU99_000537, partial [Rhizoclosmatium hyalinum]
MNVNDLIEPLSRGPATLDAPPNSRSPASLSPEAAAQTKALLRSDVTLEEAAVALEHKTVASLLNK